MYIQPLEVAPEPTIATKISLAMLVRDEVRETMREQ